MLSVINTDQILYALEVDWNNDSRNKDYVDRLDFDDCVFELANSWVKDEVSWYLDAHYRVDFNMYLRITTAILILGTTVCTLKTFSHACLRSMSAK